MISDRSLRSPSSIILRSHAFVRARASLDRHTSSRLVSSLSALRPNLRASPDANLVRFVHTLVVEVHNDQLNPPPVILRFHIFQNRLDVVVLGLGVFEIGKATLRNTCLTYVGT